MIFEIMYRSRYFPGQRNYHCRRSEKGGEGNRAQAGGKVLPLACGSYCGAGVTPGWAEPTVEVRIGGSNLPKHFGPGHHTPPCGTPWFGQEKAIFWWELGLGWLWASAWDRETSKEDKKCLHPQLPTKFSLTESCLMPLTFDASLHCTHKRRPLNQDSPALPAPRASSKALSR